MKKITISILLSLLCVSFVYCQKNRMKWGGINKSIKALYENDGKSIYEVLDMDKQYYYLTKSNKKLTNVKLLQFEKQTNNLINTTTLKLSYKNNKTALHQIFETEKGKFTYQSFYQKGKMHFITSQMNNFKLGASKEVLKYSYNNENNGMLLSDDDNLTNIIVSPNKKYVGFINNTSIRSNNEKEEIAIGVFNSDMDNIWERVAKLQYPDSRMHLKEFVIDDNGTIYLFAFRFDKGEKQSNPYVIFKITEDEIEEIEIEFEADISPMTVKVKPNFNGDGITICGSYFARKGEDLEIGVYSIRRSSKDEGYSITKEFSKEIIESAERTNKRNEKQISGFYTPKFVEYFSDGAMCIVIEKEKGYMYSEETNDIIVTTISPNNEIINIAHIRKEFSKNELNYGFLSCKSAIINDRLYIVYNSFEEIEEEKMSKSFSKKLAKRKIFTDLTIINKEGKIETTKTIVEKQQPKNNFVLMPSFSCVKGNTFLFNSHKKGKNRFGLLEVE